MTKSQHYATKLRIFSLMKVLGGICAIKVGLLAFVMMGGTVPSWLNDEEQPSSRYTQLAAQEAQAPQEPFSKEDVEQPQIAALPAPEVSPHVGLAQMEASKRQKTLPQGEPPKLVVASSEPHIVAKDGSFFDLFSLKNLPIPLFGSVSAAHAASTSLPVPPVPAASGTNTFSPVEQIQPYGYTANVLGDATGKAPAGSSLPPRGEAGAFGNLPALPTNPQTIPSVPTPAVKEKSLRDTPNAKAQELARQQQDILMLRQQMDLRLKDLQGAENRMKDLIREARALEDKQVRSLINIYSNMKPKVAAKALENMDDRVAVRILSGMPPKQAGEILTYTNPEKTAEFSELITRMKSE